MNILPFSREDHILLVIILQPGEIQVGGAFKIDAAEISVKNPHCCFHSMQFYVACEPESAELDAQIAYAISHRDVNPLIGFLGRARKTHVMLKMPIATEGSNLAN